MKINVFSFLVFFCAVTLIAVSGSEAFGQDVNLALNKNVRQSSIAPWGDNTAEPELAVDGKIDKIAETKWDDKNDWFEVDLGAYYKINKIVIHSRNDDYGNGCCRNQFHSVWVIVTDQPLAAEPMVDEAKIANSSTYAQFFKDPINGEHEIVIGGKTGRYIRLQTKDARIELQELQVFGEDKILTDHKPNPAKAWDAVAQLPFDPNFPNFRGATGEYLRTLWVSPKIVGVKNSATSFDIAFQDHFGNSKLIKVNTYEKSGESFKKNAAKSMELTGLGTFGGFAKDEGGNRYVFTGTPWTNYGESGKSLVYKNSDEIWKGQFFHKNSTGDVKEFLYLGGSRMAVTGNSLLITSNFTDAHSYQVILDTQDKSKNTNRAFFESTYHHNYGQRLMFDGKDFVIMENRDHDVSVTLTKVKPSDVFPLTGKNEDHAYNYASRIFSVYSHTNFGNNTFTELGNVEKGLNDENGYLVLFAGERDWDYKLDGYNYNQQSWSPQILSPRDIGLVHVRKDFNTVTTNTNWLNGNGERSQCPKIVDNSAYVNSGGTPKTVKYRAANDGWNWDTYNCPEGAEKCSCRDEIRAGQTERTLRTSGVNWITNLSDYKKAAPGKEFTSANHPKLVRISKNNYIVLWEEWIAQAANADNIFTAQPKKTYVTTKAVLITLSGSDAGVTIKPSVIKDLGKIRLMPGDDAFEFEGKAAWAVGDVTKGKLMFYTVDADLKLASYELEL